MDQSPPPIEIAPKDIIPILKDGVIIIGNENESLESFLLTLRVKKLDRIESLKISDSSSDDDCKINFVLFSRSLDMQLKANKELDFKIQSTISILHRFFDRNPYGVIRLNNKTKDLGVCLVDFRKIIPTKSTSDFLIDFCDSSETFVLKERFYFMKVNNPETFSKSGSPKPYIDLEIKLKYKGVVERETTKSEQNEGQTIEKKDKDYLSKEEKLKENNKQKNDSICSNSDLSLVEMKANIGEEKLQRPKYRSHNEEMFEQTKEITILQVVTELEDWMDRQKEMFRIQLNDLEKDHLATLTDEWEVRKTEYEDTLVKNIDHCKKLITSLNEIVDSLKMKELALVSREKKLLLAKEQLEMDYKTKYQDLKNASRQLEYDFEHQLKLHELQFSKLSTEVKFLLEENTSLKNVVKCLNSAKSNHEK